MSAEGGMRDEGGGMRKPSAHQPLAASQPPHPSALIPHPSLRLVLIGYRATGKTSLARLLAQRLGWDWIDADVEVERRAGKSIARIFAEDGERIVTQEEDRNINGRPDRLTRFSPDGQPTYRCTIRQEITFESGEPVLVLDDSTGDRFADRR